MCLLVVPILVPYWSSLGLTLSEILQIQAAFGISVALFEVPTGYLADIWNRKASVCLGAFVYGCCFTYLPFAESYESLMLFEISLGFAAALSSGADTALVYDSLPPDSDRLRLLGGISVWALFGETLAAVTSGILVLWSFHAVTYTQACISWMPFILSLFFVEPKIERMERKGHFDNFSTVVKYLVADDSLVRLIFLNGVVWSLSTFCVIWIQQEYWSRAGVPTHYFGFLWAGLMLIATVTSKSVHRLEKRLGAPTLLVFLALAPCIGYFMMAMGVGWLGVCASILFYVARGVTMVLFQDAFNWKIPSHFRATANSINSFLFRLTSSLLTPLLGIICERWGLSIGLSILGGVFLLLFWILLRPLQTRIHELRIEYIPTVEA